MCGLAGWLDLSRRRDAEELHAEALELLRRRRDGRGVAILANELSLLAFQQRRFADAAQRARECMAFAEGAGDAELLRSAKGSLGIALLLSGDPAEAARLLAESVRDHHANGEQHFVAIKLSDLGAVAAAQGEPERAARLWGASDALHRRLGARPLLIEAMVREAFTPQAQRALGPERFEAERLRGEALPLEAALALAEPGDAGAIL
jgi:non-specific serine/threonine protein kinase